MDLEELRAFLHVVDSGSFLAAADQLRVSRTTLRRRVSSLESRAGVPLLESTQQGIVLTDAGKVLAKRGRALEEEAGALLASVREVGQEPSGVLRVSMPVGLPPHVLATLFAALRAAYPRLHVDGRFSDDPLSESLSDIDLAVHFSEIIPKGKWISTVVLRIREWLVASRGYLDKHGTPTSLDDLAKRELFAWRAPGEDGRAWALCKGGTFTVEPTLVSSDIHFVRHCCLASLGIGLIPDALLPEESPTATALVPVLPDLVGRDRSLRVTVPAALSDMPKIKMVLERLRALLGQL
ncbi:MAG: LysR family transcriptional regulator [Minicystis sp.]